MVLKSSWIKDREILNVNYLRMLEPDRLLHNFRINAGIESDSQPLTGWESPEIGLRGHFVGHYLSALSSVVSNYNDTILFDNLVYIVDELRKCQEKLGNGYLSAFPETEFQKLENGQNNVWAPYYTYHKIMQGLFDVYKYTHNQTAFDMVLGMADYVIERMNCLDEETISKMLYTTQANPVNEPGGMNEIMYELYEATHDFRYLDVARKFDRDWFLVPLIAGKDILSGLHSNTHIAIINGFAKCYSVTGDIRYFTAVRNFWDMLVMAHSYVNGSSSGPRPNVTTPTSLTSEHWGVPGHLSNTLTGKIAETCVSHNFLKLSSRLFQWTLKSKYADAYMNGFYNSIMALQNKSTGEYVYHLPLGSPRQKEFLSNQYDFRCCNGSSIEAFSRLNENIYFHNNSDLWVNLYIPSILKWKERNVYFHQNLDLIKDRAAEIVFISNASECVNVNLFIPSWAKEAEVYVNDVLDGKAESNSFYQVSSRWKSGDKIRIQFTFDFRIVSMPDDENVVAIFHGPILLAVNSSEEIVLESNEEDIVHNISELGKLYVLNDKGKKYFLLPLFEVRDEKYSVYMKINTLKTSNFGWKSKLFSFGVYWETYKLKDCLN